MSMGNGQQQPTQIGGNAYESYYNATSYLAPYHPAHHPHFSPHHHHQAAAAQSHHYRHLQAADYMNSADYNAIQRSSAAAAAADMWAAHKFHGF